MTQLIDLILVGIAALTFTQLLIAIGVIGIWARLRKAPQSDVDRLVNLIARRS